MSDATVLGHTVRIDDVQNPKIKRVLIRVTHECSSCMWSDRNHEDHHDRHAQYADHTDRYSDYSDHEQCGAYG